MMNSGLTQKMLSSFRPSGFYPNIQELGIKNLICNYKEVRAETINFKNSKTFFITKELNTVKGTYKNNRFRSF